MSKRILLILIFSLVFLFVISAARSFSLRSTIWLWKEGKMGKLSGFLPTNVCLDSINGTLYVDYMGRSIISVVNAKNGKILKTMKSDGASQGMAFAPSVNRVYVAEGNTGKVMVINAQSNDVIDKIYVGNQAKAVGFDPEMNTLYVTDPKDKSISIIDVSIDEVIDTIKLSDSPNNLYISDGKIYVTTRCKVLVIDGKTNKILKTFHIYGNLEGITVIPKINKIYVILKEQNEIAVLDMNSGKEIKTIPIDDGSHSIVFDSKHNRIYITNYSYNSLSVINPITDKVTNNVKCSASPYDMAINGEVAYITNSYTNSITVVDIQKNKKIAEYNLGVCSMGMTSDKKYLYVCNTADNNVFVIDKKTNNLVNKIKVGFQPTDAKIDFALKKLFVANESSNIVSVVDLKTQKVVQTIKLPGDPLSEPFSMDVDQKNNVVYVVEDYLEDVVAIDASTGKLMWRIPVGKDPTDICFDKNTNQLYVTNERDNTVSVIDCKKQMTVKTIKVGEGPYGIILNELTNTVYVANYFGNSISVINTKNNEVIRTIKNVDYDPSVLAVDSQRNIIFVITNTDLDFLKDGKLQGAISVGNFPGYVYFDKFNKKIYVSNFGNGSISVIY